MFRLLEKMDDESVPVPETEPLNLHEDLKKLEDEINTLKQVLTHRGRDWHRQKKKRQKNDAESFSVAEKFSVFQLETGRVTPK